MRRESFIPVLISGLKQSRRSLAGRAADLYKPFGKGFYPKKKPFRKGFYPKKKPFRKGFYPKKKGKRLSSLGIKHLSLKERGLKVSAGRGFKSLRRLYILLLEIATRAVIANMKIIASKPGVFFSSVMVTKVVELSVNPSSSVTVRVTVYVSAFE